MTIKTYSKWIRVISMLLAFVMVLGVMPVNVIAATDKSNEIIMPVEDWVYNPSGEMPVMFMQEAPMLFSARGTSDTSSASDTVNVHVTAHESELGTSVNVEDAVVHLYVNGEWIRDSEPTDAEGKTTVSLAGLSIEERKNATISADKVIARGTGLSGNERDLLFDRFPHITNEDGTDGGYYRYTTELHSEEIDDNGNWVGTQLPITSSSDKVDMVFAIDTTGSMSDEINNVKNNIADFAQALINEGLDIRFCIIEYLDITTNEPTYVHTVNGSRWYNDVESVISVLEDITLGNGGDWAETPIDALGEIADTDAMKYRSDAHKFAFVLTDADYKNNNNYGYADMDDITRTLAGLNIVTSVITNSDYKSTYSTLYNTTGGIYADIYANDFNAVMLDLANNIIDVIIEDVTLTLTEGRMLINLAVCYYADDSTSQSETYRDALKDMLNIYSHRLAETTDGHVLIDKILLFSTDNRTDFYYSDEDDLNEAAMADIRIESDTKEDGTAFFNVKIHSNAHPYGFFSNTPISTSDSGVLNNFHSLKNKDSLLNRFTFARIQMGGIRAEEILGREFLDNAEGYARALTHETGHYFMGFRDEYEDADSNYWEWYNRPYSNYGLMDDQNADIELSKTLIDYSYLNGDFNNEDDKSKHTEHSWEWKASCEDVLSDFFTGLISEYVIEYTKASSSDRTSSYEYAELTDDDYIPYHDGGGRPFSLNRGITSIVTTDYFEIFESTSTSLGSVVMEGSGSTVSFAVTPLDGYTYSLFHRESGDEGYNTIEMTESGGVYTAELPVDIGELAEIRLVAEKDGSFSYNTYYVDRSELTDVGYLYTSADNAVMAYVMADEESSYTFVADNTSYTNGEYVSVNQATVISSDNDVTIDSGEIYSVASYMAEIDYTTLSWFQYKNGVWTQLATDYSEEENMNIGARADLDGEGLYVLMAKKAPVDDTVFAAENLSFTQASNRDAVVTMSFDDKNTDSKYYNVYYSESEFTDKNADNVVVRSYNADSTDLVLNLIERGRVVYAAVEIVLEDGTRSPLSALIRLEAGEADSDGDSIPDWYCDKYRLWGKDGEDKDIANSDDDGDGLTNLEEYRGDSDPTNPNDPVHTTNIPVTGVSVSASNVVLTVGMTQSVTATVAPVNATNQRVIWTVDDPSVVTISATDNLCTITGTAIGITQVYVVTADGGYSATINVEVAETIVHDHNNADGIYENDADNHWKICDDCGNPYDVESHTSSEWIVDLEATSNTDGSRHKECTICGYVIVTETIPNLEEVIIFDYWTMMMIVLRNKK